MEDGEPFAFFIALALALRWWAIPYLLVGIALVTALLRWGGKKPRNDSEKTLIFWGFPLFVVAWPLVGLFLAWAAVLMWWEGRRYRPVR